MNTNQDVTPDIVLMRFGSHLYHLDTPNSDVDYKGIYLPSLDSLLLGNYPKTINTTTGPAHDKNGAGDVDREVISLPQFIRHACAGETYAIDMLHCADPIYSHPIWDELVAQRQLFYSNNLKAFVGYVRHQAAKYGVKGSRLADIRGAIESLEKLPLEDTISDHKDKLYFGEYASWKVKDKGEFYLVNGKMYQSTNSVEYALDRLRKMYDGYGHRAKLAEKNEGVDWKALSHALRAGYQARDIYRNGDFEYPLKETNFIKQVKLGELDFKEVSGELERLVDEIDQLVATSDLREKVDTEYWDEWLLNVYKREFGMKELV